MCNFLIIQMSLINQSQIQVLLKQCQLLTSRQQGQARQSLISKIDKIYQLFKANIRLTYSQLSLDAIVKFSEIAVEIAQHFTSAKHIIELFFERVKTSNQFYIRALLVKAKVVAYQAHRDNLKGEDMLLALKQSLAYITKALELIAPQQQSSGGKGKQQKGAPPAQGSIKSKYSFLIYNASTTLFRVTRFMLRPGWQRHFADIYERIYKNLQELEEPDHNWKCRFCMILYQCLYDADKKADAFKVLEGLWEKTKSKPCEFQDALFRLRVYLCKENNALVAAIKKDTEGQDPFAWKILESLQRMRCGLVPEPQIEKELMTVVNQISLSVLSNSENSVPVQLSPVMQERLAEAGRIALRFNLINLANSIILFLSKTRQPSQTALILNEYNKAEILIKRKGEYVDKKTGMAMSAQQVKDIEIENRKEALKMLEKVMLINKKIDQADLIYQGAVLIWNTSLPFLTQHYYAFCSKALDVSLSLLEQVDSIDYQLRTKMHLQLINIYFKNDLMFAELKTNIFKALALDPSLPNSKLPVRGQPEEDPSLYTQPYHRYLQDFKQKVLLKLNQVVDQSPLDVVTQNLWTLEGQKSETTKIDTIQACLKTLLSWRDSQFSIPSELLVQEEVKQLRINYQREKLLNYKRSKLLAFEIAKLSFEWELNDFAKKACELVLADTWDTKNAIELIIAQAHCSLFMAQIKIDELYQANCQPLFEEENELGEVERKEARSKKDELLLYLKKTLEHASNTQQSYLIFNGAICIWNNFLHIFKINANDTKIRNDFHLVLKDYFEAMRNYLRESESKGIPSYDSDDKIQAFSNIGIVYTRILQSQKQTALVEKVCEDLLLTNLSSNIRKIINGIKARVSGGKASIGGKPADAKKGAPVVQKIAGFNDNFILEVNNQLESIRNSANKTQSQNLVVKCYQTLENWQPNDQDESELELHAELWVKLARLASNLETTKMLKLALKYSETSLKKYKSTNNNTIPSNRLRWYSLAYFISSETLLKMVNPKTQEASSIEGLLFLSLNRGCQAAEIGFKCCINLLVVDACKQVWNVCTQLQESKASRKQLLQPLKTLISYLKDLKQDSEPDLLLLMSQLYFRCAWENAMYVEGETIADFMLDILPKSLHRPIWEAKMMFMSKQGKNELQAISSIKEAEPSLQAKLWVKLARIAPNLAKQQSSYVKALEILKKEHSIEMVEVLIEYSEWQLRVGKQPLEAVVKNLEYANNLLVEIEPPGEMDEEENNNDDHLTLNSHNRSKSHRSKKSVGSRSIKSSQKQFKKDKKPTQSVKSKSSAVSRMNRSGQAAKSVKNKNTKSLFSVREEEPNPQALNCLHFERLFRINTILSSIHTYTHEKRIYAFNAYQHVLAMLQKSIETFNELQENAAKVNEKDDQLSKRIVHFPKSIEQWINYQLPTEYLQKIDKIQNFNFLGSFALQKPELTYSYVCKLVSIFEQMGLNYQTVPLLFMSRYLTKHIIKNEHYFKLQSLKLKRTLILSQHPLESSLKIRIQDFNITEEQSREEIIKADYLKTNASLELTDNQHVNTPNLIQPLSKHLCWLATAEILIEFGEVSLAKNLLRETLKCAKVVANPDTIGKVHILLSRVAFLEGENMQAIQQLSVAHRLCKSLSDWQRIANLSSKVMFGVKKVDLLKAFLFKISHTTAELIDQSSKEGRQRSGFAIEIDELKQLELNVNFGIVQLAFNSLVEEDTKQNRSYFSNALNNLHRLVEENQQTVWNITNNNRLIEVFGQVVNFYESKGEARLFDLGSANLQLALDVIQAFYRSNKQFLRTSGLSESEGSNYNQGFSVQIRLAFLLVRALLVNSNEGSQGLPDAQDYENAHSSVRIIDYLNELSKDIAKKSAPFAAQLNNLEESLTILNDIQAHLDNKSTLFPKLLSLQLFVTTLLNRRSEEAIQLAASFRATHEQKLQGINLLVESGSIYQAKAFEASVEQLTQLQNLQSFQYLSKFQHVCSVEQSAKFLKKRLNPTHPCLAALRLLEHATCCNLKDTLCSKQKLLTSLTTFSTFEDSLKLVPKNSIVVVFQLNRSRTKIYCGMLITEGDLAQRRVVLKSKDIGLNQLKTYQKLEEELFSYKKVVTKTPYEDQQKLALLSQQFQPKLKDIRSSLEGLSGWWLKQLLQILRTPKANPNVVVDNTKKGAKQQKKKGGKDEVVGYQSPVPASPSGIESVTFLLDKFFYSLPFEELLPSDLISTVSKDHSFYWFTRKLQEIGFQAELNNSSGFGSEKGKYFAYDYKQPDLNFKNVVAQVGKYGDSLKWEGIESSSRLPSLGDYGQGLTKAGFMQIYGNIDLMNHIKLNGFIENVGLSRVKLIVIHDNLNYVKSSLTKFKDLNIDGLTVSLEENEQSFALAANLLNATLIKNRWVATPAQVISQAKQLYRGLAGGIYVGAALRQSRKDPDRLAHEWMCYLHGPPVIRL